MNPDTRYSVACWGGDKQDHPDDPFGEWGWSESLAERQLGSPSTGLTLLASIQAVVRLYNLGWSDMSVLWSRE